MGHKKAFHEAFDKAILTLMSNRGVELRSIDENELRSAACAKLVPYVEALERISDYDARKNQVVGCIVRVVCAEALRLKNRTEVAAD
ncbi:MAG: hypothetical protein ACRD3S_11080 [Terracidiphilus sp.]